MNQFPRRGLTSDNNKLLMSYGQLIPITTCFSIDIKALRAIRIRLIFGFGSLFFYACYDS
jgi:hypothetical protein